MKSTVNNSFLLALSISLLTSCTNSQNNRISEKELELQKKELELKQKELELKEKELSLQEKITDTTPSPTKSTSSTSKTKTASTKTSSDETSGYNYGEHSSFQAFWADFQKAIASNDRESVAVMTHFPFHDKYQELANQGSYGSGVPLTANSKSDFLAKYDKIIIPATITAVKSNNYRGYEYSDEIGGDVIQKGEYLLNVSNEGHSRMFNLAFSKKNGIFKLTYMPFYP